MGKQTDKIKSLIETFPQLSEVEAKQLLEVHGGSVEDASSAVIEEESKWSKVKAPAAKVDKKEKTGKHKTPAGVAAAASPRDGAPRGDRPPREPRAPRGDISEPVKKVAPKVEATMKIEIGSAAKVANGMSFLDMLKKKKEVEAPVVEEAAAAPASKKGDDKKVKAPVEEEEVTHDPSQDPPAPTQSQQAAAAAEVVATPSEEPVAKKERVKKVKAPKPAKVETLYYVPVVETSETVSFPDHVLAHHIDESIKFTSNPGEAPAPPAVVPQHVPQQHMTGMHHHQQQRYGGYNAAPNAGYGSRMNTAPRQHVSQWQQNPQQGGQAWQQQQPARVPREYQQRPPGQYVPRNDFRNGHDGQVDPAAYNMRTNNATWGN